jgi:hypothetical protein
MIGFISTLVTISFSHTQIQAIHHYRRFIRHNSLKYEGSSVMVWAAILSYSILLVPLLPFMAKLMEGSVCTGWVIRCIPWSRCCFRTTMHFSKTRMPPFTELELFSHGLKSMKVSFSIFPGTHIWTTLVRVGDYSERQIPTSNISKATWRCSSRRMVKKFC